MHLSLIWIALIVIVYVTFTKIVGIPSTCFVYIISLCLVAECDVQVRQTRIYLVVNLPHYEIEIGRFSWLKHVSHEFQ